jgi:hypothetical protein
VVFNIGSQTGGVINNVGQDQHVHGDQHGEVVSLEAARQAVDRLRTAVRDAPLDPVAKAAASAHVEEVAAEVSQDDPDRSRVAGPLRRLAGVLVSAGPVVTAARDVAAPLSALVTWLGAHGAAVASVLGGLI